MKHWILIAAMVLVPALGRADPIQITLGSAEVRARSVGSMDIAGADFSLSGVLPPAVFLGVHGLGCCVLPGTTVNVGAEWQVGDLVNARVVLDGETYTSSTSRPLGGILRFSDLQFTMPDTLTDTLTLTAPFDFVGGFFLPTVPDGPRPTLVGSGTGTLTLFGNPSVQSWDLRSVRYDFADPEPIPEPGTLLLFGSGASLALAKYRRRRSARPALTD